MDDNYIVERIREISAKLSNDKRRFLDILLHTGAKKILGEALAKEYLPIRDPAAIEERAKQLPYIQIVIEAVNIMPDVGLALSLSNPHLAVAQYFSEAFGSIVGQDPGALQGYSKTYDELTNSPKAIGIEGVGVYPEAYNLWIKNTALYLRECRKTVRAISLNEFTHLWDKPSALDYLATHYLLRKTRDCDSRRVFIYDHTYAEDNGLLKRLFTEVQVQWEAGVNVRVCSKEQLEQIGRGYYYPLLSFGTYDRRAMGVLIPHDTNPVVKLIHEEKQIRESIAILDDIFDHAETRIRWSERHASLIEPADRDFIQRRVTALQQRIRVTSLH